MKYWRGYVTAGIFAAITWALMQLSEKFTVLVDMFYPYITRTMQTMLAGWSSGVDICLWQLAAVLLAVVVLATIVLMIIFKWNPIQWFGWVLTGVSLIFMLHTMVIGLNTYAGPLYEDLKMQPKEYTVTDLAGAAVYYRDKANDLAAKMPRDDSGDVKFGTFEELADQAGDGFDHLVYDRYYAVFAGSTLPVKKLGWADMYTSMGITGLTMGLTGEAAVNPQIPAVSLPFTMGHEMAHRMCIASERDANFTGFLSCIFNEDPRFQYSGYYMAYKYCYSALLASNTSSGNELAQNISQGVSPQLKHDLDSYNQFFASKKNEKATKVAEKANDTYIKASGDELGTASYDTVSDLMVQWYIQEVILPAMIEEEVKFDPYDEEQVDLWDMADETTAPAEE